MTLAVMARATRGHTGHTLVADHHTIAIYALVNLAAVARVLVAFAGSWAEPLLGSAFLPIAAFVARLFMSWVFLLTFTSMLPMALAAYGLQPDHVGQVASAITGASFVVMQMEYPVAGVTREATPLHVWLHFFGSQHGLLLLLNAAYISPRALAAIYVSMVTLYVMQASFAWCSTSDSSCDDESKSPMR